MWPQSVGRSSVRWRKRQERSRELLRSSNEPGPAAEDHPADPARPREMDFRAPNNLSAIQSLGAQFIRELPDHIAHDFFCDLHVEEKPVTLFSVTKRLMFGSRRGRKRNRPARKLVHSDDMIDLIVSLQWTPAGMLSLPT